MKKKICKNCGLTEKNHGAGKPPCKEFEPQEGCGKLVRTEDGRPLGLCGKDYSHPKCKSKNHNHPEDIRLTEVQGQHSSGSDNSPQERKKEYNKEYYQENKELHKISREKKLKENPDYDKEEYYGKKDKESYKKAHRKANIKYDKNNPEKLRARTLAQTHIKLEGLCEKCQVRPAEHRHHPDYSKPLFVKLLCHKCHREIHKNGK